MKNGLISFIVFLMPYFTGRVLQLFSLSPLISLKSFVEIAPIRNSIEMEPMYHGVISNMLFITLQPANIINKPLGIAIVMFPKMAILFVLKGGEE